MGGNFIRVFYEYQTNERVRDLEGSGFYKVKRWKSAETTTTKDRQEILLNKLRGIANVRNVSVMSF